MFISKKLIILIFSILFIIIGCDNNSLKNIDNNSTKNLSENNISVDNSKPINVQLQQIFSKLSQNSQFVNVKIKSITHPASFVGTWTMWNDFIGDKSILNADGSCSDILYNYRTGKESKIDCLGWYHITLEKSNYSFLLFLYPNQTILANYEWSDKNNLLLSYFSGGSNLVTRTSAIPLAKNIKERFFLGKWKKDNSNIDIFWTFDINNKLKLEVYKDDKLVVNEIGTWDINKTTLKTSILNKNQSNQKYFEEAKPPKSTKLSFYNGIETIVLDNYEKIFRYSEPLMSSIDPFIGRFQAHNTDMGISLSISKKSKKKYNVDIFWNKKLYANNSATQKDELLYVDTEFGEIIFKPVINGILKINRLKKDYFNFYERISKISQNPNSSKKSLLGRWIQSTYLYASNKNRSFIFLDNGIFYNIHGDYNVKIGRKGTYRKDKDKIYFKSICGEKELYDNVKFNSGSYNQNSYKRSFFKINNSEYLSSMWYAINQYTLQAEAKKVKLIPHPTQKGKFLFAKKHDYSSTGFASITFYPDGSAMGYNFYLIENYHYYIEQKNGKEQIILIMDYTEVKKNPLPLYDGRNVVCLDNVMELYLK